MSNRQFFTNEKLGNL